MDIKTRVEAATVGDRAYYTGKACKYGHVGMRRTDNGACVDCQARFRTPSDMREVNARQYVAEFDIALRSAPLTPERSMLARALIDSLKAAK